MEPDSLEFVTRRFDELPRADAQALLSLTLSRARGDLRDGETSDPGSSFRLLLHDLIRGFTGPLDRWAVIAYEGPVPAGWCLLERLREDPITNQRSFIPEGAVGFYVDPQHRRRAVAARLLRRAQDLARKEGWHRLVAFPWNRSSSSFFASQGFDEKVSYRDPTAEGSGVACLDLRAGGST